MLTVVAGLLHLGEAARGVLVWVVVSLVLDLVTVGITAGINVPANNRLKAAGDADVIDVAMARADFDEGRWVRGTSCGLSSAWRCLPRCCGRWYWRDA